MANTSNIKNFIEEKPKYIPLIKHILRLGENFGKFSSEWLKVKTQLYDLPKNFGYLENIGVLKKEEKFSTSQKIYYSVPCQAELKKIVKKNKKQETQGKEKQLSPQEILKLWTNSVQCFDCVEAMKNLPDNSIDLVVTSPPYDDTRDYAGFSYDLQETGKQIHRLLKPGGIAAIVIQDQTKNYGKTLTSFKIILDWCEEVGFKLFECLIYKKHGVPGAWWKNRFRVDHEYIPLFLKGRKPRHFNKEPLKVSSKHGGKTFKGGATRLTSGQTLRATEIKINNKKCRGTIWEYLTAGDGSKLKHLHPATFPDELPIDLIKCFCPAEGIVLDPFIGSGTTALAAKKLGRKFIGFDTSQEYCELSRYRLKTEVNPKTNPALL